MEADNRSVSRGRDNIPRGREPAKISTGRGGAGNIVRSPSRDIEPESLGHINSANLAPKGFSSGRGGAGNIRSTSTSREGRVGAPEENTAEYEREVLQRHADARKELHVTGRGGLGNISPSRSRSKSKGPAAFHASGRGGAGNMHPGSSDPEQIDIDDDEERLMHHTHTNGVHSTGRGGAANLTPAHAPGIEVVHHHEAPFESSGRGGAGNIRDRSVSREPGSRNPSRDTLGQLWNKVTHPHLHEHTVDPNAIQEVAGMEGGE